MVEAMKRAILGMGLASLLVGCMEFKPPHLLVYVDAPVPREAVEEALRVWEPVGGGGEVVTDDSAFVFVRQGDESDCEPNTSGVTYTGALRHEPWGTMIYVRMRCYRDGTSPAAIIAHEIGHLYGLDHIEGRPALMNAAIGDSAHPELTDADRKAFRDHWSQ